MPESSASCALELMDTGRQLSQANHVEVRLGRGACISIPQFWTLRFIQRNPNASISDLVDHLGPTLLSVFKLVEGLVKQQLVDRRDSINDRRRLTLELTQTGDSLVNFARANAQARLAKTLSYLSDNELKIVGQAMELLRPLFDPLDIHSIAKK